MSDTFTRQGQSLESRLGNKGSVRKLGTSLLNLGEISCKQFISGMLCLPRYITIKRIIRISVSIRVSVRISEICILKFFKKTFFEIIFVSRCALLWIFCEDLINLNGKIANKLTLNQSKTEFMLIESRQRMCTFHSAPSLAIAGVVLLTWFRIQNPSVYTFISYLKRLLQVLEH